MNAPVVQLARPGAGIPLYQRAAAKFIIVPWWRFSLPWDRVPQRLREQASRLEADFKRAAERAPGALTRRVLIPPAAGLEDDSRYWSLAMVADHLARVNRGIAEIIDVLTANVGPKTPPKEVRIADYKPDPGAGPDALSAMHGSIGAIEESLRSGHNARKSRATHPHPWFGPLSVPEWAIFPAMHQSLHLAQARAILARL